QTSPPAPSLNTTLRKALPSVVGLTQASAVIPVVRSSELELMAVTHAMVPLKERAFPNLPLADQAALERVPVLLLPDWSAVVVPLPSAKTEAAAIAGRR